MNKKSLVKISAAGIMLLLSLTLLLFLLMPFISNAFQLEEKYTIGEDIKINLEEYSNYTLKIITPSNTLLKQGNEKSMLFKPEEIGNYSVIIISEDKSESFGFEVVEIGNLSNGNFSNAANDSDENKSNENASSIVEKTRLNGSSTEDSLNKQEGVETQEMEVSRTRKKIKVISTQKHYIDNPPNKATTEGGFSIYPTPTESNTIKEIGYNKSRAYSKISEELRVLRKSQVKLYSFEEEKYVEFNSEDKDNNGIIDGIVWNINEGNLNYEIIIITKAMHLDAGKNFISDIYESVKALDGIWSETINQNEYVRVTFEKNLTKNNDITIYPKVISGNPMIEVYAADTDNKVTEFNTIKSNELNKVYLTNLIENSDSFDLKIIGGSISFDYIVDPSTVVLVNADAEGEATGGDGKTENLGKNIIRLNNNNLVSFWTNAGLDPSCSISSNEGASWSAIQSVAGNAVGTAIATNGSNIVYITTAGGNGAGDIGYRHNIGGTCTTGAFTDVNAATNDNMNPDVAFDGVNNRYVLCTMDDDDFDLDYAYASVSATTALTWTAVGQVGGARTTSSCSIDVNYNGNVFIAAVDSAAPGIVVFNSTNSFSAYTTRTAYSSAVNNMHLSIRGTEILITAVDSATSDLIVINSSDGITYTSVAYTGTFQDPEGCIDENGNYHIAVVNGSVLDYIRYAGGSFDNKETITDTGTERYPSARCSNFPSSNRLGSNELELVFTDTGTNIYFVNTTIDTSIPDRTPPQVNITAPENKTYATSSISFNLSLDEPGYCEYTLNNGVTNYTMSANASSTGFNATNSSIADGNYNIIAYCNDSAGNINYSVDQSFTKDATPPIINIVSPLSQNYTTATIYFNVSLNENTSWCGFSLDNSANISMTRFNDTYFNFTNTTMTQGNHNISFACNDTIGNMNSSSGIRFFGVDTIAPSITIVYPPNATNSTNNALNVNYTFIETNPGSCWWTNDSGINNYSLASCMTNITTQTWPQGFNTIRVYMNDTLGNTNFSQVSFTIDSIYPLIEFGFGTENNWANKSQNWIYLNVTVNETNEENITFFLFNSTGLVNETAFYDNTRTINWTSLLNGIYYYNVSIVDISDNENSTETRTITLDTQGPVIEIEHPESRIYAKNTSLPLNYSANDILLELSSCWWNLDNGNNETIGCGQNTTFNASDGEHTLYFYSNDSLNNIGYNNVTFSVSTQGPAITLEYPSDNFYLNYSSNIVFNYTPRDPDGVDTCKFYGNWSIGWHLNQTDNSIENYSINSFTVDSIPEGTYIWNVWCNDSNGLESFSSNNFTFTTDATYPLINFGFGTENNWANKSQNWIYLNVTVNETNEENITFFLFNSTGLVNETAFYDNTRTINWTSLLNGIYYYNVSIVDISDNENSTETRIITLDTIPPDITILSPEAKNYSVSSIDFNVSINEPGNCSYSLNNGITNYTMSANASSTGFNATNSSIADGQYTVSYYCNDSVGNTNSSNVSFFKDTVFPQISIAYPPNATNTTNNALNVNYTFIETNPGFCWWTNDSGVNNYSLVSCGTNVTGQTWPEGLNTVRVYTNDTSGNTNFSSVSFTIDSIAPFVNLTYPLNTSYAINVSTLNYSYSDLNPGSCWYSNNSGSSNSSEVSAGTNFTNVITNQGSNTLTLYCNDSIGNQNSSNVSFFEDTINPFVNFGTGTETSGSEFERDWIFVNVTINETNFANITFYLYNSTHNEINSTNYSEMIYEINWTNLDSANVSYYYNATVYDVLGNENSTSTRTIKLIDISSPYLEIVYPQNSSYDSNETLAFDYIANDAHLANCSYKLNNGQNITLDNCQNITIDVPEGSNILYLFANDTLGNSNMTNVSFYANNSLIFTNEYQIQKGSTSVNGVTNVVINKTDKSKSFIIHNVRGSSAPNAVYVSAKFFNSTMLQFENYAGAVNVEWEIITGPDISVQRGEIPYNTTNLSFTAGINSINLSDSFIIVNTRLNSSATTDYTDGLWVGDFLNANTLNFTRLSNGALGNLSWQAVSWSGANVQNTSSIFTTVSSSSSITNAVNTSKSFIVFSYACSGAQLRHYFVEGILTDSNNVLFARNTASGTVNANAFVIEWPRILIQRNTYSFGAANSANITITPLFNDSRSFRHTSLSSGGSGSTNANALVTSAITNQTNLNLQKSSTGQTNNVSWQVVEIVELEPPSVNLIYPVDNSNFSFFDIDFFNYTVNDSSPINNCSLYGNWSAGWHRNQTFDNPEKLINQNFSSINTGYDGYYIWNVQCIDLYGNVGINSTNYTFAAFLFPDKPQLFNITQANKLGTGNITLFWNSSNHSIAYMVYYSNNLSDFVYLNETSFLNYTDTNFSGNKRRFYRIDSWNPTGQNSSNNYFGVHVYYLTKNSLNTRNWIGFPTNFSYLNDANATLWDITNATAFTMWNETIQKRVTCNLYSCPDTISCTETNCNFSFSMNSGKGYEVNINSSAPNNVNWSGVGIVNNPVTLNLVKNDTSYRKNWIGLNANSSLGYAKNLFNNITNAEVLTKWNSSSQTSIPFMRAPWNPLVYLGKNFSLSIEEGYEVSVNATTEWTQN